MEWLPYAKVFPNSQVIGDLRVLRGVFSHDLAPRDLIAYLPPSYALGRRAYPVLYMHDGINLFDPATSFGAVDWGVSEAAETLARRGLEAIIIGIPCDPERRIDEYGPWRDERVTRFGVGGTGGLAGSYLAFMLETVKPLVDSSFRTRSGREHTGVAGSSMGGLVSLWAVFERPDAFGFCAAFSPALWFAGERIFDHVRSHHTRARVYLDMGSHEGLNEFEAEVGLTIQHARRMRDALLERGADLAYLEDPVGEHHERDWRRRFPAVLEWFLDLAMRPGR